MSTLKINPYTGKPTKMVKMYICVFPEEKAKVFTRAKKACYNGVANEVIRELIKEMK